MKTYMWAFLLIIPIVLVVWSIDNSAEEPKYAINGTNSTMMISAGNQYGLMQDLDIMVSVPEVEEVVEAEDIQTEDTAETEEETEKDAESGPGTAIYQERYEEFQEHINEARDYIAAKLPDTDISDEELPEGVCLMDICEGDLDGDDKPDFAVVLEYEPGYEYFRGGEFWMVQEGIRPIYVYTYVENVGYQCGYAHHHLIRNKDTGGMMGDPYAGMEIKDKTLTVSDYGGSSDRWANDYIFEIKGEELVLKEHDEYVGSVLSLDGMRGIWSFEEGTFETYANTLLINRGTYEAKTIPFQEVNRSELQGIVTIGELPYLSYHEGYEGLQDDVQKNAASHTAEEALDIAKEENYPDMHRVDIVCEEEIFDNYETLLGYAPSRYYYEDDAGNRLTYRSRDLMSATHEIVYHGVDNSRQSYKVHD